MPHSDETRSALDRLHRETVAYCQTELEAENAAAASGDQEARVRAVSISATLNALEFSKGTLLRIAPVVVHGDLATAHRVVVRVAEPSFALREEMVAQSHMPSATRDEIAAKQAKAEELTGRKLADVLAESAALATELGEGHAVVTAPSPTTHGMPNNVDEDAAAEREANAHDSVVTIRGIPDLAANHPTITLLFDYPDPRIADRLLQLLASGPLRSGEIDEIVVVDGELVATDKTADKVVALPADPHRGFELEEVSLNRNLGRSEAVPEAKRRPLIAVPQATRVRFAVSDNALTRAATIAPSLLNSAGTVGPSGVLADAVEEGSPLSVSQQALLIELQTRGISYVVTGVVGLRFHAYAAGIDVPEWFSPRRYPMMELALEPRIGNLEQGFAALHDLAEKGLIEPYVHPIPTGTPVNGQTANLVLLNAVTADAYQRAVMISYGKDEIDSYPRNPVADIHAVIGTLEIPIARPFEAEAGARRKIETAFEADDLVPTGLLVLDELRQFVRAIDRAHKTLSAFPRGRVPAASRRSRFGFPRIRPNSDAS